MSRHPSDGQKSAGPKEVGELRAVLGPVCAVVSYSDMLDAIGFARADYSEVAVESILGLRTWPPFESHGREMAETLVRQFWPPISFKARK